MKSHARNLLLLPAAALLLLSGCETPKSGAGDTSKAAKASTAATAKATSKPTAKAETTAAKAAPSDEELTVDKVCGVSDSYKKMDSDECGDCFDDAEDGVIAPCKPHSKALLKCMGGDEGFAACDDECDDSCDKEDAKCCRCMAGCAAKKDKACQQAYLKVLHCWHNKCESKCK